jgi:hypothetical protein
MISRTVFLAMTLFGISSLFSCSNSSTPSGSNAAVQQASGAVSVPSPPCIVYKTKADFDKYVPVILSEDKSRIVSYPDVKDIYYKGELAYPVKLSKGYLLDNRGIGPDVAFLDFTYEIYSKLAVTPSAAELMNHLLNKDPILEMYDCGSQSHYNDAKKQLNSLIESGQLEDLKRLK